MDKLFERTDDEGAKGVGDAYSELLDCGYGRCWSVMAESIECLMLLGLVCLKLFPSLVCFNEDPDGGWKVGCAIIHSFGVRSIWLKLFTFGYVRWGCAVKVLTYQGTESSVCINCYWGEDHLIVEKIANDVITRNWRRCSAVVRSVKFIPFMVLEREICVGSVICDTICRRWRNVVEGRWWSGVGNGDIVTYR